MDPRCPQKAKGVPLRIVVLGSLEEGMHQRDDDNQEDEDKKVYDDIELTCIK